MENRKVTAWMETIHAGIFAIAAIAAIYAVKSHGKIKKITIELSGKDDK